MVGSQHGLVLGRASPLGCSWGGKQSPYSRDLLGWGQTRLPDALANPQQPLWHFPKSTSLRLQLCGHWSLGVQALSFLAPDSLGSTLHVACLLRVVWGPGGLLGSEFLQKTQGVTQSGCAGLCMGLGRRQLGRKRDVMLASMPGP